VDSEPVGEYLHWSTHARMYVHTHRQTDNPET